MSPSESDLRAALHDGEGRGPNVDHVIFRAQAIAAQRRVRLMSGAAIMAVVLGTGVGIGYLANSGSDNAGSASAAGGRAGAAQAAGASAPHNADGRAGAYAAQVACPNTFPHYQLPGGGGLDQFGADGPLFPKPVASVVVCAYGIHRARLAIDGEQADALADGLENASKTAHARNCIGGPGIDELAILPIAANGSRARTVTVTFATCGSMATNGTAVRYGWNPPPSVRRLLSRVTK